MVTTSDDDPTHRVNNDFPFRRLHMDARLADPDQREKAVEIVREGLGKQPNASSLLVFATHTRGGGPRWFLLAIDAQTGEDATEDAVAMTRARLEREIP